ncbi:MAG TPA: hypothetical protein VIK99_06530 [Thermaerobacter sp.]
MSLTYAELNRLANRVARSLLDLGLRHQEMLGACPVTRGNSSSPTSRVPSLA